MKNSTMPGSPSSRLGLSHLPSSSSSSSVGGDGGGYSRGDGPVKLSTTNLYIKGLPADTTDQSLKSLCHRHGTILSTKAVLDPQTNKCKGFGFVDFETAECAQAALEALRQLGYQVGMAKKQEQAETNVFFKNLPEDFTKEDLESIVKQCGVVSSVHIMKQNGRSQGVGFARMASKADCEKLIMKYNNVRLPGCKEPMLVKFADLPNRQKSQQARIFTGQELQGALALPAGPTPYLFPAPPQAPLSIGTSYADNSFAAMTMAAQGMSQMSAVPPLHVMAMPNMTIPQAQYPTTLPPANYGYLSVAPAPTGYPQLPPGAQYGAPDLQLQPTAATATAGTFFVSSAAGMQQVMPGMQATMDPTVSGMTQWQ
ncbi:RNA-binding motif, single-stranded-interacting protein 3-like isoform X2 [Babylonia areolata]|uniref:RNA-binding motif, single-stranded-interacting protein 3-like isoform X2 n=1 Tax=Babylonia areolata TaxID=304850 RepID=UPI003FD523DD